MKRSTLAPCFVGLFLVAHTGCSGDGKVGVTGTILLAGKPVPDGTITFYSLDNTGTQSGSAINEGKYEIKAEKGLLPGKYRVAISSPDGETPVDPKLPPGPRGNFASKERIPPEWNTNSKEEVIVTAQGPNRFDFKIP